MNYPTQKERKPEYPISDIFIERWSPRAMSGESIKDEELMSLFEAAKWSPSSYNNQEWRFIYAKKDLKDWNKFLNLLSLQNKAWAERAAVLIVLISKKTFDYNGKLNKTHSLSAGAAWMSLALQGSINNLVIHGMAGFDYEKARKELNIPNEYSVEMMIAVGKAGKIEDLPKEYQKGETPSDRKKLSEIVFQGNFKE